MERMKGQCWDPLHIQDVFEAKRVLRNNFPASPLLYMEPLNQQLDKGVYIKAECLLPSGAYKLRGATNKINSLVQQMGKDIKVVAASSGNHGFATAYASKLLGIDAKIVVPTITPEIKRNLIRKTGATLVVEGENVDGSFLVANELSKNEDRYFIHPVNDKYTIAGQGTIALEILEQNPDVDQVLVPLGGGGLLSGIAYTFKMLKPSVKVIGIQAEHSDAYYQSYKSGKIMCQDHPSCPVADAVVTGNVYEYLFDYVSKYCDDIVTVSDPYILKAIKMMALYSKLAAEGAGSMALASVLEGKTVLTDNTVFISSGANMDQKILEQALAVEL